MYRLKVKPWKSSKFVFPASPEVIRDSLDKTPRNSTVPFMLTRESQAPMTHLLVVQ
jgi:hypothetical protein